MAGFKKRYVVAIIAIAVILLAGLHKNPEPRYNGRSLSQWLRDYEAFGTHAEADQSAAADAVREIGTNALPFLITWISYGNTNWHSLFRATAKMPGMSKPYGSFSRRLNQRVILGAGGFTILGTNAAPAVPALVYLATNQASPMAISALWSIGRPAMPALKTILENPSNPSWESVLIILAAGSDPWLSPQELAKYLNDPDPSVRTRAKRILQRRTPELLTNSPPR